MRGLIRREFEVLSGWATVHTRIDWETLMGAVYAPIGEGGGGLEDVQDSENSVVCSINIDAERSMEHLGC